MALIEPVSKAEIAVRLGYTEMEPPTRHRTGWEGMEVGDVGTRYARRGIVKTGKNLRLNALFGH